MNLLRTKVMQFAGGGRDAEYLSGLKYGTIIKDDKVTQTAQKRWSSKVMIEIAFFD